MCSKNFGNVFVHFALGQQFSNILIIQYFPQVQIISKCCSVVWQFLLRSQELCNSAINACLANFEFIDLFLLDVTCFLLSYVFGVVDSLCIGMGIARRADATFTILRIYYYYDWFVLGAVEEDEVRRNRASASASPRGTQRSRQHKHAHCGIRE